MTRHLLSLFLLFLSLLCSHTLSNALCITRHRDALLRLSSGFNNSSVLSWTLNGDCCLWPGVACDNRTGEVTGLDLSGRFLSGMVDPDALFNLTSLVSLNLSFNNLNFSEVSSRTSEGFEMLGRLTTLNLSYSGFVGQIPMGVASLTNLVSLDFSTLVSPRGVELTNPNLRTLIRNLTRLKVLYLDGTVLSSDAGDLFDSLSESVPKLQKLSLVNCNLAGILMGASLPKLGSLTVLRLDQNNVSSDVPTFVGSLSSLQVLSLRNTGLTGLLPEEIFRLRNLTTLDMSSNPQLGGYLPGSIGNLGSLERLLLSNCRISGSIPASISRLTKLVKLDLSNNNLSGELPPFDSTSTSLAEINLANNNLSGSIPTSYADLQNLAVLDLQTNSLTGQIPSSLFKLPSLKTLDLHENKLAGSLEDLSYASSPLETFDVSQNRLQGPIPTFVFKLSSLKILTLSNNNFNGTISLNLLHGLVNLSSLDLSYNRLSITEPEIISFFPNISTLKLASCGIIQFPSFLKYQLKLTYLDLSANKIASTIPQWLWSIGGNPTSLNHLNLSYNMLVGFEGPLPDLINSSLKVIDLHNNSLNGSILSPPALNSFVDYSNNNFSSTIPSNIHLYLNFTIFFSISNNRVSGSIPDFICSSSFLQVLDLSLNNLSGSIPSCLAQMKNLRVLNLRGNSLNGSIPSKFNSTCNLRTLNLNKNQLQGALPVSLSNCMMLEVLDVGNNHLDGEFPCWLGDLTGLRVLVLRSNKFSGPLKARYSLNGSFSLLQIIDLSSNKFNGSLSPKHFVNLKAMVCPDSKVSQPAVRFNYLPGLYYQDSVMVTSKGQEMTLVKILTIYTSIDLSNNSFDGSIPDAVGMLTALKVLSLSQNSLSGPIPSSFGQLKQLESLDLSHNRLSGIIPKELMNLSFLSFLNLSDNDLSGEIPQGGQFGTFSNASYLGNPQLCGLPLLKCSYSTDNVGVSRHACRLNWMFIFIGLGLGGGLALVFGPLLLFWKWRKLVNDHVDEILLAIFPSSFWEWVSCGNGRIDAEEKAEEESDWVDEGPQRLFCVFCTELKLKSGQAIIVHRECSCTRDYT